ncbi:MAG TPA: type II toxin-antitoxin system Phd/YefM family antitoxin [Longimicrobiales bacterium]
MATLQVSYSYARDNLAEILDTAIDTQEPVIIKRRGREDVAVLPAAELLSLNETAHLLRSPKNAQRLLAALRRALENSVEPTTTTELKEELGLE